MNSTATNLLHFIPIGRLIADPIDLPTAITLAIFGKKSTDGSLSLDENGEIIVGVYNPRTGGHDRLLPGVDNIAAHEFGIMLTHGSAVISKAMHQGDLDAFVINQAGSYLRVPRLYWLNTFAGSATVLEQTESNHIPDELVGAPLLVDPADSEKWANIVRPAVNEIVTATRESRGENVAPLPRKKGTTGPDPYKEYPTLERVFKAHNAALSNLNSDRARHNYLIAIWALVANKVGRDKCPSYEVVKRCWGKFKGVD